MSNQQQRTHASQNEHIPWWVQFCRWLWKYPLPFLCLTLLINIAINIGSTLLITPANSNAIPDTSLLGRSAAWVSGHWLLAALLATMSIALLLLTWLGSRWPTSSVHVQIQISPRDREHMIGRLRVRYEQVRAQSLQGAVQIELGLVSRPTAVLNAVNLSLRLPEQPEHILPPHITIVDAYNQAQQELLVLGEPGAGKSTLLVELAHLLLHQAEQDETQPLPFVVPLASWANRRLPFQEWLIGQVKGLYEVPLRLSRQWVEAEQVLPLLDGLDEMEEAARAECVAAINTYHREHLRPLVVCSRTQEYELATRREQLALHTAVVVQPLTQEQVEAHLTTLGKPLAVLRAAFKRNATLAALATTPLMLHILILTYQGTTVRQLSEHAPILEHQIWKAYIERMVQQKGDRRHYPLERTLRWLTWLARMMGWRYSNFALKWMQPDMLPERYALLCTWSVLLIWGLLAGLLSGLYIGLLSGLYIGLLGGLLIGLVYVLPFGLLNDISKAWVTGRRILLNERTQRSFIYKLLLLLVSGLDVGLFIGLIGVLFVGGHSALAVTLQIGLGIGLSIMTFERFVPVQRYTLRFWLWRAGLFPWKAVPFLEDATKRNLLRRVGGSYSFTHRLLLEYLADLDSTPPSPPIDPHVVLPTPHA